MTTDNESFESTVNDMPGQSPASTEASSESPEDNALWGDIASQLDEGENELDELEGAAPPETPPAEEPPAEAPPEPPVVPPVQQESPPETAATPEAAPEAPPATPPVEEPAPEPAISEEKFNELRTKTMENVAKRFELSDEDADLFLTEPQKAIPQMGARLFMEVYESVMRGVHMAMPGMMQNIGQVMTEAEKAETEFYSSWPGLNKDEYRADVVRLGAAYRQANPTADVNTFIRDVGAQAMVALKLPIPGAEQVEMPAAVTPAPAAQVEPFIPASPSGGGQSAPVVKNPFTELSIEFEMEDQNE